VISLAAANLSWDLQTSGDGRLILPLTLGQGAFAQTVNLLVSTFDSKMLIRGNKCKNTCHTPAFYDFQTDNKDASMDTNGEIEDVLFYKADTQKMAKYEVNADTVTDMINNYMP
jgi:hypothetical protein